MGEPTSGSRRFCRRDVIRVGALLLCIAILSLLHYSATRAEVFWHESLLRLYYIPVLCAAYWYGPSGGLLIALVSSMAYVPHVWEQTPVFEASRFAEIVVFHVTGATVGFLAARQRRDAERYRLAAETLEHANEELRASSAQLRRADRLKTLGEVAAGLAHELRHPLASIRGALEIIEDRASPATPEAEFSKLAMSEVERLDDLVREFLHYARPHEPDLRPTCLVDVIDRVVALLGVQAERVGVRLDVGGTARLPDLWIDGLQIEQVLLNVVLNGIQASPRGSLVRVQVRRSQHDVAIDVVDQGTGIASECLAQVFDPFFTTKDKGTGLGLAIASRIVQAHHGRLDVVDTSPRGTSVRISLPIVDGAETAMPQLQVQS